MVEALNESNYHDDCTHSELVCLLNSGWVVINYHQGKYYFEQQTLTSCWFDDYQYNANMFLSGDNITLRLNPIYEHELSFGHAKQN